MTPDTFIPPLPKPPRPTVSPLQRRLIIIGASMLGVLIIAGAVVLILWLTRTPSAGDTPTPTPPAVATPAPNPAKDTCAIVSLEAIKTVLGKSAEAAAEQSGKSEGTAANGELAERCTYTFTTDQSPQNSFVVERYLYKPGAVDQSGEQTVSLDWYNVDKATYPTYFQEKTSSDKKTHTFTARVINGPSNYLFIITQPADHTTFDMLSGMEALRQIANGANYS